MSRESVLTRTPENTSFLQTTKFTFVFPQLPFARYFCQSVNLPSVSTSEVLVSNPFVDTYRHGDKLIYEPITITALVDEDLRVWEETYKWLVGLTKPTMFPEYRNNMKDPAYLDAILTINTNANIPNLRIKFRNCHPTSIGTIQFNSSDTADITPVVDITFRFDYFEFERL